MSSLTAERSPATRPEKVAPYRHTAILTGIFVALAVAGFLFQSKTSPGPSAHPNVVPLYLSLIAMEWGLLLYVRAGIKKTGTTLRDLVGARWSVQTLGRDIALAAGLWLTWMAFQWAVSVWIGSETHRSLESLFARNPIEIALWVVLSISAGICEEIAFRGYFRRQFAALTASGVAGVAMQAALFGIAHGYQGVGACFRIVGYGLLFGTLAAWLKSLRPGMIAHAFTDIVAGLNF